MAGYATAIPSSFSKGIVVPLDAPESEAVRCSYIVILKDNLSTEHVQSPAKLISVMSTAHAFNNSEYLDSQKVGISHVYVMPGFKGHAGRFDKKLIDVDEVDKNNTLF